MNVDVSSLLGWLYFIAWSLSFYPQVVLNATRESVSGLSLDFCYLNLWGFFCYSIFNLCFYYSPEIQRQYKQVWNSENLVQLNDVFFGLHALSISAFTLYQAFLYGRREYNFRPFFTNQSEDFLKSFLVSSWVKHFLGTTLFGAIVLGVSVVFGHTWALEWVYYFSFVKMMVTLIKYTPQAVMNYRLKSTSGWSIGNILLDLTGGIFSMAQLVYDASLQDDWYGIAGNPVKFGLGVVSISFDLLFIVQHYILYRKPSRSAEESEERSPLLSA